MAVFVAAVAVTISGAAFAKDLKGSVMIHSEMLGTATGQVSNATDALNNASDLAGRRVGWGLSTAGTPASVLHPPELIEAARRTD